MSRRLHSCFSFSRLGLSTRRDRKKQQNEKIYFAEWIILEYFGLLRTEALALKSIPMRVATSILYSTYASFPRSFYLLPEPEDSVIKFWHLQIWFLMENARCAQKLLHPVRLNNRFLICNYMWHSVWEQISDQDLYLYHPVLFLIDEIWFSRI